MRPLGLHISLGKGGGGKGFTAKDYIQDGLVAMWDGIENAGWGKHDASATVWKDLVGGTIGDLTLVTDGGFEIKEKCIYKPHYGHLFYKRGLSLPETTTLEACVQVIEFNPNVGGAYYFPVLIGMNEDGQDIQFGWKKVDTKCTYRVSQMASQVYNGGGVENNPFELQTFSAIDSGEITAHLAINGILHNIREFGSRRLKNILCTRGFREGTSPKANYYSIRLYNRVLTADEVAYNYNIDKARFGL